MKWHVIYTHYNEEYRASERLEEQDYTVYLPEKLIDLRYKRRVTRDREALFPRYLFIQLSKIKDDWRPIQSTPGVVGLVKFGLIIPPVEDEFINELMGYNRDDKTDYESGDKVLFNNESFFDVPAIVKLSKKDRVDILLSIMGKQQLVNVDKRHITPL